MKTKTIDIDVKEWFDKSAGTSYFAGTVTVNHCLKGERTFTMPFKIGYGEYSKHVALSLLMNAGLIKSIYHGDLTEDKIVVRYNKENCLKRELMEYKK